MPERQGYTARAGDTKDLLGLAHDVMAPFADRNTLMEYADRIIFMDQEVEIPDEYRETTLETRLPFALHTVNTISAALSVNPPATHFDPVSIGDTGLRNQTLREKGFDAAWERQERESHRRLTRQLVYSAVAKGESVCKTIPRAKRAWGPYYDFSKQTRTELYRKVEHDLSYSQSQGDSDYQKLTEEYKRSLPYPITTMDVPPENFYYLNGEDGYTCVVEVKDVDYYEALVRYQDKVGLSKGGKIVPAALGISRENWRSAMKGSNTRTLRIYEVWDGDYCRSVITGPGDNFMKGDGQTFSEWRHGYGIAETNCLRGPYFHCFGVSTSSRRVESQGLSLIFGFLRMYELLNSLVTMQAQTAYRYAYTAFKRKQQPGLGMPDAVMSLGPSIDSQDGQKFKITPGAIVPWDLDPIELGHGGVDLDKMISFARETLNLALPSVVQGVMSGDESGYALNQASHLARLLWDPIVDNLEFMLSERVGFESWLIEHDIGEPVWVWGELPANARRRSPGRGWLRIAPEDLAGNHLYHVKLDPSTPTNELIQLRSSGEALRLRVKTPREIIEDMGGNYDENREEWLVYDIEQDPRVKGDRINKVLAKLDIQDEAAIRAALGAMPPNPEPGAGPTPQPTNNLGMPLAPEPGAGMPLVPPPPSNAAGGLQPGMPGGMPGIQGGVPGTPTVPQNMIPLPGQ